MVDGLMEIATRYCSGITVSVCIFHFCIHGAAAEALRLRSLLELTERRTRIPKRTKPRRPQRICYSEKKILHTCVQGSQVERFGRRNKHAPSTGITPPWRLTIHHARATVRDLFNYLTRTNGHQHVFWRVSLCVLIVVFLLFSRQLL